MGRCSIEQSHTDSFVFLNRGKELDRSNDSLIDKC